MTQINSEEYYIIGMSPGNSYFKDEAINYLLETTVKEFGRVAILIPDVPAISTYIALGYSENRARRDKAIPKGNALRNLVVKNMEKLGYSNDVVRIIDWQNEIENNAEYKKKYEEIASLYNTNANFKQSINLTTEEVLRASKKDIKEIENAIKIAVHYILSEFAFLEFAPQLLNTKKVSYIYHKNWQTYEDYISGKFDNITKTHLGFLLI